MPILLSTTATSGIIVLCLFKSWLVPEKGICERASIGSAASMRFRPPWTFVLPSTMGVFKDLAVPTGKYLVVWSGGAEHVSSEMTRLLQKV